MTSEHIHKVAQIEAAKTYHSGFARGKATEYMCWLMCVGCNVSRADAARLTGHSGHAILRFCNGYNSRRFDAHPNLSLTQMRKAWAKEVQAYTHRRLRGGFPPVEELLAEMAA